MDYHHRTGFGPEITEDDLNAAGRAELARMKAMRPPEDQHTPDDQPAQEGHAQ